MVDLIRWFLTSIKRERGATAIEYALLVALIAIVIIVGLTALGVQLNTFFTYVKDQFASIMGGG